MGNNGSPMRPSVFSGPVRTAWLINHPRKMVVISELRYNDLAGRQWKVPAGAIIDGASTGWFLRRILPAFVGRYRRATVFHDYACKARALPSPKVHSMFFEAMVDDGVPVVQAWLMWLAVRVFGPRFKV